MAVKSVFIKKKAKITKKQMFKATRGVISLFLCMIMSPVLMVASALVEYYRHQETVELTQELVDSSALSVLANYDTYLQNRFGLFSVSQNCDIKKEFSETFDTNKNILGGAIGDTTKATAKGTYPLSQDDVLKNQLLDFSENTVLTEVLLEDLNIQDLINKLNSLTGIDEVFSAVSTAAELTKKIKGMVTAGKSLIDTLKGLEKDVSDVSDAATTFSESIATLFESISNDIEDLDLEDAESIKNIAKDYASDIKQIYSDAKKLKSKLNTLKSNISSLSTDLSNFKTAFNNAKDLFDDSKVTEEKAEEATGQEDSNDPTDMLGAVLEAVEDAVTDAGDALKESTIKAIKDAATEFTDTLTEELGLNLDTYNKDYYKITDGKLSEEAEEDLKKLLSHIPEVWEDGSFDGVVDTLKDMFLPSSFNGDFLANAKGALQRAIDDAESALKDELNSSVAEILSALVNALEGLFDLQFFYDGRLCAYLDDFKGEKDNPYVTFLSAVGELMDSAEKLSSGNIIKMLDGLISLFKAIGKVGESVVELAGTMLTQIKTFANYIKDPGKLYEMLLLSGYMTHNLPNRTNAGDVKFESGLTGYNKMLGGTALTGFPYTDIPIPSISPQEATGLLKALQATKDGGSDPMFMGAELEYIMAGTPSEIMNQIVVFMNMYFLRLVIDIPSIFADKAVNTMAGAATIASWAVYLIVILAEPLCDTVFLVNGNEIPLFKGSCYLSPVGIPKLIDDLADVAIGNEKVSESVKKNLKEKTEDKLSSWKKNHSFNDTPTSKDFAQMSYETHALILLFMTSSPEQIVSRFSTLVEYEVGYYHTVANTGQSFSLNKAYSAVEASVDVGYNSFLSVFDFDENSSALKQSFRKVRGY